MKNKKNVARKKREYSTSLQDYLSGKSDQINYHNHLAKQHGFIDSADVRRQIRLSVLKLVQLGEDYNPPDRVSTYNILKLMKKKIENTKLKCICCGELHEEFMTLDHINNNGSEHRRKIRNNNGTAPVLHYLLLHGFKASDYQVLCFNCNASLGFRGYCPHHPEIKRIPNYKKRNSEKQRIVAETKSNSLFDFDN